MDIVWVVGFATLVIGIIVAASLYTARMQRLRHDAARSHREICDRSGIDIFLRRYRAVSHSVA